MSKILELAEEIDKERQETEKKIVNLISYTSYLESELNKEKEKGGPIQKRFNRIISRIF